MAFIRISAIDYVKEDEYGTKPTILNTDEIKYIVEQYTPIKKYDIEQNRHDESTIKGSKICTKDSGCIVVTQSVDELFQMLYPNNIVTVKRKRV